MVTIIRRLLFCFFCLVPTLAWAVDILPSSVLPERQTAREPIPQAPGAPEDLLAMPAMSPSVKASSNTVYFNFAGFSVEGNTILNNQELLAFYQDKINTEVTLTDLNTITNNMEAEYVKRGYILTRIMIPAQTIEPHEKIKLIVLEGYVDKIDIRVDNPAIKDFLANMAQPILASRPLQLDVLEKTLLLMDDLPGISIKSVLSASDTTHGASTLTIDVTQKTLALQAQVDNRGTIYTGPWESINYFTVNNPGGYVSQTVLEATVASPAEELFATSLTHNKPFGSKGTYLEALVNYSETRPGEALTELEVHGYSGSGQLTLHQPIIRQRLQNLSIWAGYDLMRSKTNALDELLYLDRIESLRAGFLFDRVDGWQGTNLFTAQVSTGLNLITGPNQPHILRSRYYGTKDYTKLNATFSRLQNLPWGFAAVLSGQGQYSFNDLLAAEQFGVGGEDFGLAYDYYEISGDSGFSARLELHRDFFVDSWVLSHWQPYLSYDGGQVWSIQGDLEQSLTSLGGGLRFHFMKYFTGRAEVAKPLTKTVAAEHNKDARGFLYLTANF